MTWREADLGKWTSLRRRCLPIAVDIRQEVGHARAANPLLKGNPQQPRVLVAWVPSITSPPSGPGGLVSKVGTAYCGRLLFPYQDVDGSCAPRPMAGAYREGPLSARILTPRRPGASMAKLSAPLASRTFVLVVVGVVDA
jgi:hypothetical protein